ncbi:co-chaperone YbbN [Rhizobium sp. BK176]|uniref:thioredoxin family protein n=1 Tax=Rhizobium sp. BK176 TaxID=2587071 RepID=UPI002167831A|nr:thioredoxin family protein [Rhizobium sp. BK176]MCS4089366.1 hypothetical protein [Rhizobium sp. BK176]
MNWVSKFFQPAKPAPARDGADLGAATAHGQNGAGNFSLTQLIEASHRGGAIALFTAAWSGPDKLLVPILASVCDELSAPLFTIDVDKEPDLTSRYGVKSVPTVMSFVNGEPTDLFVGAKRAEEVRSFVIRARGRKAGNDTAPSEARGGEMPKSGAKQKSASLTGTEINEISGRIDAFAKERGYARSRLTEAHSQAYWQYLVETHLPRLLRDRDEKNKKQNEFMGLFTLCFQVRGIAEFTDAEQFEVISGYHRTILMNFLDDISDGDFFAASAARVEGRPIPSRGAVNFAGVAQELMELYDAPKGAHVSADSCNAMVRDAVATFLKARVDMVEGLHDGPIILFDTLDLDLVAKSSFESWREGKIGFMPFFIRVDMMDKWRETRQFREFERDYLADGLTVRMSVPEATERMIAGTKCRLAMMYPVFPEDFAYISAMDDVPGIVVPAAAVIEESSSQ